MSEELQAPTVRLAAQQGTEIQIERSGLSTPGQHPGLLVSYVYLAPFLKNRARYAYRDWVLDSGAFSAHVSGTPIDLLAYIETCQQLRAEDPLLTEIFALDVIGDWKGSVRNAEQMWKAGVPAIPTFHVGSPEDVLLGLARDYPKIALGGAVGYGPKFAWAEQCFARVWPKKIHGFGFGSKRDILALPWHSVDATNWVLSPCKFGSWRSLGKLSIRGSKQNLRAEVDYYLKIETDARFRWRREMALLEAESPSPTVRLAMAALRMSQTERYALLKEVPL